MPDKEKDQQKRESLHENGTPEIELIEFQQYVRDDIPYNGQVKDLGKVKYDPNAFIVLRESDAEEPTEDDFDWLNLSLNFGSILSGGFSTLYDYKSFKHRMKRTTKISLFKELYYWMYFYVSITIGRAERIRKYQFSGIIAGIYLSVLRILNFISLGIFVEYILKSIGFKFEQGDYNKALVFFLVFLMLFDWIYFPKKANFIITTCEQFQKKRRVTGQVKFWAYITFTILFIWCIDKFFR
ncbi:hypothetical protein FACS189426_01990 [Bacteroidia bacterium]|nr:hypothetical protein FACS189426_01990 [Bacteroidia bacterium]